MSRKRSSVDERIEALSRLEHGSDADEDREALAAALECHDVELYREALRYRCALQQRDRAGQYGLVSRAA